jgi:hypothetical protein
MSLASIGNPAWNTIRGVRFSMRHGGTLVAVLITHSALAEIEPFAPEAGGPLACFTKYRNAIEKAASGKHQRGEFDEDGVVIVIAGDLKLTDP